MGLQQAAPQRRRVACVRALAAGSASAMILGAVGPALAQDAAAAGSPDSSTVQTVVVTGSGREKGLGQAILRRFAEEGAACVVSDRAITPEAEGVAEDLRGRGAKVAAIACDVSDPAQCAALVEGAMAAFGRVDVFVNNAGIGFMMRPLLEVDPADWDTVLAVNLMGEGLNDALNPRLHRKG